MAMSDIKGLLNMTQTTIKDSNMVLNVFLRFVIDYVTVVYFEGIVMQFLFVVLYCLLASSIVIQAQLAVMNR